jgi:TonB family protein
MNAIWTQWEGAVVHETYPLRRFLSASDHSGVFLTEHSVDQLADAAIKITPTDPARAQTQLSRWDAAAALSHPHLIRLLDSGRCQLGDGSFLFVVMEYAGETLFEILPARALTYDEIRQLLIPTLEVLSFLHSRGYVHGRLRPSNILVVEDQPKLASDTICRAGALPASIDDSSPYDAPETKNGQISAASDMWALGMTLVEALTQRLPAGPAESLELMSLAAGLPPIFVDTVRRCLSPSPHDRPTVAEFQAQARGDAKEIPPIRPIPRDRARLVRTVGIVVVIAIALWAGFHAMRRDSNAEPASSSTSHAILAPAVLPDRSPTAPHPEQAFAGEPSAVLHEENPEVPLSASSTIHGHIDVTILVTVDRSGNVVDETIEKSGASQYFARAASAAAKKWKFAPTDNQDSREWLLSFEFSRGGTTAHATMPRS